MTSENTDPGFTPFAEKMQAEGLPDVAINNFHNQYRRLLDGQTGIIAEDAIHPVEKLADASQLGEAQSRIGEKALTATVMIKLNGGLGTSMGLEKAKSLIPVKQRYSFLDIIIRHAREMQVRLLFMNSFSTRRDTLELIDSYTEAGSRAAAEDFLQHKVPKVSQDNLAPVTFPDDPRHEWCPPGHGDIYIALHSSALLDRLLDEGIRYALISNADNLGATLDKALLGYLIENELPFLMEVTERSDADRKGGHLAINRDGGLLLRESAQCREEDRHLFEDIQRHRYFNTNNLWLDLQALKKTLLDSNYILDLPLICNRKTVDPRDPESQAVFQLETAMGSAIGVFAGASAIRVPRTRFAPVKTTSDLLLLQSDLFRLDETYCVQSQVPPLQLPSVRLDPAFYRMIDDFQARFPKGVPGMLGCRSLEIRGDVRFSGGVTCIADVVLENHTDTPVHIEENQVLEGKTVWD